MFTTIAGPDLAVLQATRVKQLEDCLQASTDTIIRLNSHIEELKWQLDRIKYDFESSEKIFRSGLSGQDKLYKEIARLTATQENYTAVKVELEKSRSDFAAQTVRVIDLETELVLLRKSPVEFDALVQENKELREANSSLLAQAHNACDAKEKADNRAMAFSIEAEQHQRTARRLMDENCSLKLEQESCADSLKKTSNRLMNAENDRTTLQDEITRLRAVLCSVESTVADGLRVVHAQD